MNDMTYSEAIEAVMRENNGVATLRQIYADIWKFKDKSKIKGKTTNNTIQERVQRDERFLRLGLGIYGLKSMQNSIKQAEQENSPKDRKHSKLQGMLLEIGNAKNYKTYTNDKKFKFSGILLSDIATLSQLPIFTYERIIKDSLSFCDVVWLNERGFADSIFEVEISTDFRDAFIKFNEMQDFYTKFYCIAEQNRYDKFKKEINKTSFRNIKDRVKFISDNEIFSEYELALKTKKSIFNL
ncbi:MAG: hypothetical protein LUC34_04785 [Campylobacter sp.]|nr:hypothetical protein [Campylobacter sp.]